HNVDVLDHKNTTLHTFTIPRRYTNLQLINAGSQGVVVSADDTMAINEEKKRVAIKKMLNPFAKTAYAKQTYRELVLQSSVNHPNIVQMYEKFTPQESLPDFQEVYLVMELMTHSLSELIGKKATLDHKTLSFFIYQILCGVNHLHREGIIHRDLKPCNIAVNDKCRVKVLDFGLARQYDKSSEANEMTAYVVTRYYRAPEVVLKLEYTEKMDIWSIGCIFAELITKEVLFPGEDKIRQWNTIVEIMGTPSNNFIDRLDTTVAKHMRALPRVDPKSLEVIIHDRHFKSDSEFPQNSWTATDARRLISKMIAIDPSERYSAAEALQDPYVRFWFNEDEVNSPLSSNGYVKEVDEKVLSLEEMKSLIFNEVK
ncbi:hypothetical protein PENTCL1PPCAC_21339, partial [Pristionchus entomophagus]